MEDTGRETVRTWRVTVVDPDEIDEPAVIGPRESWGASLDIARLGLPEHVSLMLRVVPEGAVVVACCSACGGRRERLVDLAGQIHLAPRRTINIGRLVEPVLNGVRKQWLPVHLQCPASPVLHRLPEPVREWCDGMLVLARDQIAAGEPVLGHVYLLDRRDRVHAFPVHDLPASTPDTRERGIGRAERLSVIRHYVRCRRLDLEAALLVGEAWTAPRTPQRHSPSQSPDRVEMLTAVLVTPHAGRSMTAPILRLQGEIGEGPGVVGEVDWTPLGGNTPIIDGALAQLESRSRGPKAHRNAPAPPRH